MPVFLYLSQTRLSSRLNTCGYCSTTIDTWKSRPSGDSSLNLPQVSQRCCVLPCPKPLSRCSQPSSTRSFLNIHHLHCYHPDVRHRHVTWFTAEASPSVLQHLSLRIYPQHSRMRCLKLSQVQSLHVKKKQQIRSGVVVHFFNPSTVEVMEG